MAFPRAYIRVIRTFLASLFLASLTLFILSAYDYQSSEFPRAFSSYFHNTSAEDTVTQQAFLTPRTPVSDNLTENGRVGSGVVVQTQKKIRSFGNHSKTRKYNYVELTNAYNDAVRTDVNAEIREEVISETEVVAPRQDLRFPDRATSGALLVTPASNISALHSSNNILKYRYDEIADKKRKSKNLWQNDKDCRDYKVYFAKKGSLPVCALASYPGSGNTWTRRLLEYASGIFTGSIYSDAQLFMYGYYGEMENWAQGTTIAQKTHDCGPKHIEAFDRSVILLLRNPYRAILSFHNFLFAGHTGFAPIMNYRRKDWPHFVHLQTKSWLELAVNWTTMAHPDNLTVLHYETLKEDPVPSLTRALETRNLLWDPKRMECLRKAHSYRTFKRKEEFIPEELEIFSAKDRDKIDRAIRYVDYLLQKKGKQPLPLHLYEFYNGTDSAQITKVSCEHLESQAECDDRVDQLNHARFNTARKSMRPEDFDEERTKKKRRD
ncbi:uncharacterized protein LOC135210552 [Macrobrachium nipponense]|uniref:uncharacterized protein LOC135210552 n=1 Tax=Macrobrachium nipponense TaxID=159736 RepID=UPI0030C86560